MISSRNSSARALSLRGSYPDLGLAITTTPPTLRDTIAGPDPLHGLGMTPGAYVKNRKLPHSHDELPVGGDPAAVVATRWGLAGATHFSRTFRPRHEMPSSRLRRGATHARHR
jgi:hypothetical protein